MITITSLTRASCAALRKQTGLNIRKVNYLDHKYVLMDAKGENIIAMLGHNRKELYMYLASCFARDEIGVVTLREQEAIKYMEFPEMGGDIDQCQKGMYREDLTGYVSVCDYIRAVYAERLRGKGIENDI